MKKVSLALAALCTGALVTGCGKGRTNTWDKEPGEQFEAVVEYVGSCAPDEPLPLGMPLVLRVFAPYEEQQRQKSAAAEGR